MSQGSRTCRECGTELREVGPEAVCSSCCLALAAESSMEDSTLELSHPGDSGEPGRLFGEYRLLERLGEGGMGIVYKAHHAKLNRTVALKMLKAGTLAGKAELQRFHLEAKAAARLRCPNIVSIHEVGAFEGRPFFSMDYIQGQSLAEICARTPLSAQRAARCVKSLAEAVDFAHTQGVLHRDLKPSNILLTSDDQPHITDFGLAKDLKDQTDLTVSGAVFGTPSYMSPEQAAGKSKQIGPASDIYSLGAILYDLLTGRPPFRAEGPAETMRQVIDVEPVAPQLLNPGVDRDLDTICLKCLSKEPSRRYGTAQELADDLGRYLRQEPILARPLGYPARAYRWARRNPSLSALMALAVMFFILLLGAAYLSGRDALDNVGAVTYAADSVRLRLNVAGESVARMAADPLLRAMLRTNTALPAPEGQKSMTNVYVRVLSNFFFHAKQPNGSNLFENITLLNPQGDFLANYNPNPNAVALTNLAGRDYYKGAIALTNEYYVSRIYRSKSERTYKLGVSIALCDETGLLGILSGTVGTASTDSPTGLRTDRAKTVLAGELDPMDGGGYVVFWHPAYRRGQAEVVSYTNSVDVARLQRILGEGTGQGGYLRVNRYEDPVRAMDPGYGGPWVAGFAPVPETRLVAIHQVRDRVALTLAAAVVSSGVILLICTAVLVRRRWLASHESS